MSGQVKFQRSWRWQRVFGSEIWGIHGHVVEDSCLQGCGTMSLGEMLLTFWKRQNASVFKSQVVQGTRTFFFYCLTLKLKTQHPFQMSGTIHPVTHHTPEVQHPQYLISLYISVSLWRDCEIATKTWEEPRQEARTSKIKGRNANHLTLKCGYCSWNLRSLYAFAYISVLSTTSITVTL